MSERNCHTRSCHAVSQTVIDIVTALMKERAVDGKIDVLEMERILQFLARGTVPLDESFRAQEERCRREHSKPKGNVGARSNPLNRLMVRPFEHLLLGDNALYRRELLPNYFAYLGLVLGKELMRFEATAKAVIQALLVVHGNNLTWDHFYSDQRTLVLLKGVLSRMTKSWQTAEGQAIWERTLSTPLDGMAPKPENIQRLQDLLRQTEAGLA